MFVPDRTKIAASVSCAGVRFGRKAEADAVEPSLVLPVESPDREIDRAVERQMVNPPP